MSLLAETLGLAALVPAMLGGVPAPDQDNAAGLVVAMCQGGSFVIPLEEGGVPALPATICCAKGCQGREKRKRVDLGQ